jgi:hypothetical protein
MPNNSLDFGQTLSNIAHFSENRDSKVQPVSNSPFITERVVFEIG